MDVRSKNRIQGSVLFIGQLNCSSSQKHIKRVANDTSTESQLHKQDKPYLIMLRGLFAVLHGVP